MIRTPATFPSLPSTPHARTAVRAGRAGLVGATLTAAVTSPMVLASPVAADVPEGWPAADPIDPLHLLSVLVGVPLLLGLLIAAAIYLPALARGERVAPGSPQPENEWIGGPRKAAGELAGPDTESSAAGGAGGRW